MPTIPGGRGGRGVEVTLKYLFYDFLGKLTLNIWVLENPTPKISVKNCGFNRGFTEKKTTDHYVVLRNDKKCTNFSMNKNIRCIVFKDLAQVIFAVQLKFCFLFRRFVFCPL